MANVYDMLQMSKSEMRKYAATLDPRIRKMYLEDLNMMYKDHMRFNIVEQILTGVEEDDFAGTPTADEMGIYKARVHHGSNFADKEGNDVGSWGEGSELLRKDREFRKGK